MFDKEYTNKLDNLIKEKFPIIYDYKFNGIVLLYGGALKDTVIKRITKDLDLLVITEDANEIINFIKKYKLSYGRTVFGGYKINYNNFIVDIFIASDLYDAAVYDIDMLFYDIHKHQVLSCGAIDAIAKMKITEINNTKPPLFTDELRLKKLKYFIKQITNSKSVAVYENKLLFKLKIFRKKIIFNLSKIFNDSLISCFKFAYNFKKKLILNIILKILSSLISVVLSIILGLIIINYNSNNILSLFIFMVSLKIFQIIIDFIINELELKMNQLMCFNMNSEINKFTLKLRTNDSNNYNINKIIKLFYLNINSYIKLFNIFLMIICIYCLDYRFGILISLFIFIIYCLLKKKYRIDGKSNFKYYRYNGNINEIDDADINFIGNNIKKKNYDKIIDIVCSISYLILILFTLLLIDNNPYILLIMIILLLYNSPLFSFSHNLYTARELIDSLNYECNKFLSLINNDVYLSEIYGNEYKNKCDGNIEFKNVKFKYDNKYILNNISFKVSNNEVFVINKNERVILDLITRLYYVDSGEVLIDGLSLNNYDYKFIRENISVINQNPYLFNMSIKDNFRLIKEDITDEEIYKVCKLVYLDKCIDELPNKYDTIIGNGGIELNDFENQRLSLARAIVKNTKIILIDEIGYKEKDNYDLIMKIINKIKKNYTIIMVSDNK